MRRILLLFTGIAIIFSYMMAQFAVWDEVLSPEKTITVTYEDNFMPRLTPSTAVSVPMLPLEKRLSSKAAKIRVFGNDSLPDYVLECAEKVKSVWSSIIQNNVDCEIEIKFESQDCDIKTSVKHCQTSTSCCPYALYLARTQNNNVVSSDKTSSKDPSEDKYAGCITINSDVSWDSYTGDNIDSSKKNLSYGLTRAMCRIFGFGSPISLYQEPDDYRYPTSFKYHTPFDSLVVRSDKKHLRNIACYPNRSNPKLVDFITTPGVKFFVGDTIDLYQLADPPYSQSNLPFTAMKTGMMSADITLGDHVLQVDNAVIDILTKMGWSTKRRENIGIICTDSTKNSFVDPLASHSFMVVKYNYDSLSRDTVTKAEVKGGTWRLTLPLKDSRDCRTVYYKDNDGTCIIPPITDYDSYYADVNGVIEARLEYCFDINGVTFKTDPYVLNILVNPSVESVTVKGIRWISGSRYAVDLKVKTFGAEYIKMECVEEFSQTARVQTVHEYPTIECSTPSLFSEGYAWIILTAVNCLGTSDYIVEITPDATQHYPLSPEKVIGRRHESRLPENGFRSAVLSGTQHKYKIYDISGTLIWSGNDISSCQEMPAGTPVVIQYTEDGEIRTVKHIKH